MDDSESKNCPNCKRDIPSANYTIHSVHCIRNIKLCVVCKEPVPVSDLQHHHEILHQLMPCSQCGENVRGSDLEDHVRDSCAHTEAVCHYCKLALPRRELVPHEIYCGARTERCECGELVMFKYQQIHLQTQHGFIKLDDEPGPEPSWKKYENKQPKLTNTTSATNQGPSTSQLANGTTNQSIAVFPDRVSQPTLQETPSNLLDHDRVLNERITSAFQDLDRVFNINNEIGSQNSKNPSKRTNDMPQLNTSVQGPSKVNKELPSSSKTRTVVTKRPAPQPPAQPSTSGTDGTADLSQFAQVNGVPLVVGQPMSVAEFERRFSARLDRAEAERGSDAAARPDRFGDIKQGLRELRRGLNKVTAPYNSAPNQNPPAPRPPAPRPHPPFRLLDFMHPPPGTDWLPVDPFSPEAPPDLDGFGSDARPSDDYRSGSGEASGAEGGRETAGEGTLPCEFCGTFVIVNDLIQHETGCRPDLACLVPSSADDNSGPVIPCEFCSQPFPVYMLMHHQQSCQYD